MKKLLVAFLAISLLAAGAAIAQMPQNAPRPAARLANYLQLTPDQVAAWKQISTDTAAAVKPLAENAQSLQKQLQTALQSTSPDPAAVGKLAIAVHAARDQVKALRDAAKSKREAVLTADQKVKLDAFEAAMAFGRQQRPRVRKPVNLRCNPSLGNRAPGSRNAAPGQTCRDALLHVPCSQKRSSQASTSRVMASKLGAMNSRS